MRALAISSTQDVSAFDQLQQAIAAFTRTRIKILCGWTAA
jgi:hypothetical protein